MRKLFVLSVIALLLAACSPAPAATPAGTPLADKRVRQAINYGVDVDGIIANVLQGYARRLASPIGPLTLGYDESVKPYPYDLAKAKSLLSDAGFANGFDIVIDATNTARTTPTEAVIGELAKLNIRATLRRLDLGTFNDNWGKKQTSPLISASWSGMFDPANALNFWAKSDGFLSRYKNADADRLIADGAGTLDQTKRAQSYAQLHKVLHDDPLALYLWNTQNLYALSKRVVGWKAHPRSYIAVSGVTVPSGSSGKLVVAQTVDAQSMDPYFVNQIAGESVMKMLFDHLIERDYDGKLVAGLAESWRVVDDQTLEFKLRSGVTFHNGEPFDAAAVKFSVERMLNADLKSAFRGNFTAIKEAKVVDTQTVQLILSKTDAAILDNLSAQLAIVPPKYVQQVGDAEFARKPVGTGPFKFVEWIKDDHITLEANTNYWNGSFKGKPLAQTVVFRPVPEAATRIADLKADRVDIVQDVPPDQVKGLQDAGFIIVRKDAPQENFIFFVSDAPK